MLFTETAAIRANRERSYCPKQAWLAQNEAHTMLLSTALARARDANQNYAEVVAK